VQSATDISAELTLQFFKALADESRLRIIALLTDRERSVQEIAQRMKLREPTISHHLSILKELDLVASRADGTTRWYRLNDDVLRKYKSAVFKPDNIARLAAPRPPMDWEAKVLSHYLDGERLTKIPDTRRKRWVVLKWLAARFEPGVEYNEAQVNAIIKRHHDDSAFLRREMIGDKMLTRQNGVYSLRPKSEWSSEPR
jgi:DNA-binding transcriptional ArsR family regulator